MTGSDGKVGTGWVPIKPDTEGFGPALEQGMAREGVPAAERGAQKIQHAAKGVFLAGAAAIGKSVFDFAQFDRGMREVFTLLPDISGEAMTAMSEDVKDFATEFGVLPTETIPALYQSLSAGVPQGSVFDFLETSIQLAKGGVTDLETAVDGLTSTVNAYGSDVLSAQQASDMMFTTVKLGKTTIADLSSSLFQVVPTAAAAGVGFDQISAALTTLTAQGVPTSVATTQLRQLLVELTKDGSKARDELEAFSGKSVPELLASGATITDLMGLLGDAAAANGKSLQDMFGSVEAGSAALSIDKGRAKFDADLLAMQNSAGATEAAFETMNQGIAATFDKLRAGVSVALLDVGDNIAPIVDEWGGVLIGFLDLLGQLPPGLTTAILLVGTLTAGVVGFAGPILKAVQLFKMLGGVMTALAANPWVLVAAALAAVAILVIQNWDDVKLFFEGLWQWLGDTWSSFTDWWSTDVEQFGEDLASGIAAPFEWLGEESTELFDAIGTGVDEMATGVGDTVAELGAGISGAFSSVRATVVGIWRDVTSTVSGMISGVVGFVTSIPERISSAFSTLADVITAPFRLAFNGVKKAWNSTVGGFGFTVPGWIPGVGGDSFSIPTMAKGGVLTGPRLVMAGEYPGARTNPEIVAPQSIIRETLRDTLAETGAGGVVVHLTMNVDAEVRDPAFFEEQAGVLARTLRRELNTVGHGRGLVGATR